MADVSRLLERFISDEISLNQPDIQKAVKSREWFLKRVVNEIERRKNEPSLLRPLIPFGSYFKKTKVTTVDEFDILVVIDSNTGVYSVGGKEYGTGQGTADPNHKYDSKYRKSDDSGVSPSKLLNWLKGVVESVVSSYGGEAPERNGQAITATIKSQNLKIDLVPAGIFTRVSDKTTFYNIPKGNKSNSWITTSPREDISLLESVAKGKDNFRNVIRLAKFINGKDVYNFVSVSSFAMESAVIQYAKQHKWTNKLGQDTVSVLHYISEALKSGTIPDSYDSTKNLLDGADKKQLQWYASRADGIVSEIIAIQRESDNDKAYKRISKLLKNE